ncbi:MAG TPA: hypothetical protein VF600_06750 [Abditibacteriaceae bacterium]
MKVPVLGVVTSLCLALCHTVRAEDAATFKMPCAQVLRLGFDKFMHEYSERTNDYSTAGQKQGYRIYTECKRADNDRRLKALPPTRRTQLASIRLNLARLEDACWGMQEIAAGGGTMWGQLAAAATATREDLIASLIAAVMRKQIQQPAARLKATGFLNSAQKRLAALKKAPEQDFGLLSLHEQKKVYTQFWNETHSALLQLQKLTPVLPDLAAQQLAQRVSSTISDVGEFE